MNKRSFLFRTVATMVSLRVPWSSARPNVLADERIGLPFFSKKLNCMCILHAARVATHWSPVRVIRLKLKNGDEQGQIAAICKAKGLVFDRRLTINLSESAPLNEVLWQHDGSPSGRGDGTIPYSGYVPRWGDGTIPYSAYVPRWHRVGEREIVQTAPPPISLPPADLFPMRRADGLLETLGLEHPNPLPLLREAMIADGYIEP